MHGFDNMRCGYDQPRSQEPTGPAYSDDARLQPALFLVEVPLNANRGVNKHRRIDTRRLDASGCHDQDENGQQVSTHDASPRFASWIGLQVDEKSPTRDKGAYQRAGAETVIQLQQWTEIL